MGQRLAQAWQAQALRRGAVAWALWPLSLLIGLLVRARHWGHHLGLLRRQRLAAPVLVVGNWVAGGAGKTPTVIALVQHLQGLGWRPGVLSRGHGRSEQAVRSVQGAGGAEACGDEPLLIHQRTGVPVFVGRRRFDAGRALQQAHPEVDILVCDDGLQHLALQRDLALAVFDQRGLGNGFLLPAGLLREPWPPLPLSRPDWLLHQGLHGEASASLAPSSLPSFRAERRLATEAENALGQRRALIDLGPQRRLALAGVAQPARFFDMLRGAGLALDATVALPDHATPAACAEAASAWLADADAMLLCTEKDAVKLFDWVRRRPDAAALGARIWSVGLQLEIEPAFWRSFDERLQGLRRPRSAPALAQRT